MALYLVQHGKNISKEHDPEQNLSEEGKADVEYVAKVAKQNRISVYRIEHSPKLRAKQTAEIFAEALQPLQGLQERENIKALDEVSEVADEISSKDDLMLVGHLPFMERLTSFLITGSKENLVFKFQNGGIVCLDKDEKVESWFIKWAIMPRIE